jgi:hypothetical protein
MLIDHDTKIISVAQLSKLLKFSQFRVKSLITSGYIKAEKVNGRTLSTLRQSMIGGLH